MLDLASNNNEMNYIYQIMLFLEVHNYYEYYTYSKLKAILTK